MSQLALACPLILKEKKKKRKGKRKGNNDLANLPSHDRSDPAADQILLCNI